MWLHCSLLVSPVTTLIIAKDVLLSVSPTFPDAHLAGFTQPTHSVNKKTLYVLLKWVWCHHRISILFCGILKECWRKGKKRSKKIYEAPSKSQCGFQITSTLLWRFTFNKLQVLPGLSLALGGHTYLLSLPTLQLALLGRTELPLCLLSDWLRVAVGTS